MKKKTVEGEITPVDPVRFSDEELAEFKTLVDEKLITAIKELHYLEDKVTDKSADSKDFTKEQLNQMIVRQKTFIDHLNKALERIEDNTYGICKTTGKLIDKARLRAVPHATLSIEAKMGPAVPPPIEMPAPEATPSATALPIEQTPPLRKCRVCGCTDDNCSQCIEKTGLACHWVEEDLCSACQEPEQAQENTSEEFEIDWINQEVYFFRPLFQMLDGINIEMKVKRLNGKLIVEVLPETVSVIKPVKLTGTAEELDEGFFGVISRPVTDAKGLKFDVESYNKSVLESKAKNKPAPPKPYEKKPVTKKPVTKKPVTKKPVTKKSTPKPLEKKPPAPKGKKATPPTPKLKPAAPDMFAGIS